MRLQRIDNKQLTVLKHKGVDIYFSYETPIAFVRHSVGANEAYIVADKISQTTSRHANRIKQELASWQDVTLAELQTIIKQEI